MLSQRTISTPIGDLTLVASRTGLREIRLPLPQRHPTPTAQPVHEHPILDQAATQLGEYFEGTRAEFSVPLDVDGSAFQRQVWDALTRIPYGATESYGELAVRVDRPGAARAVGGANGRNPVPIIVPCHRVIGANGALTGYAGPHEDGIAMKRWLLQHERCAPAKTSKNAESG